MKHLTVLLFLIFIGTLTSACACAFHSEKAISTREAAKRIGEEVNVTGKVTQAFVCKGSPGRPWKLILDEPESPFVVMIPREYLKKWENRDVKKRFLGQKIIARGTVNRYRGLPEITVARHFWILTTKEMQELLAKYKGKKYEHKVGAKDEDGGEK